MMESDKKRRQELIEEIRSPEKRGKVIAYLKSLKGIPQKDPLPNGTPIISEILRLEKSHGIEGPHTTTIATQKQQLSA